MLTDERGEVLILERLPGSIQPRFELINLGWILEFFPG
jgi:hypothetical protein